MDMWRRDLIRNKLFAVIVIALGALTLPIDWDATFFLFALIIGLILIFSKENWIVN